MKKILLLTLTALFSFGNNAKAQCTTASFTCHVIPSTAASGAMIVYKKNYAGSQWLGVDTVIVTNPMFVVNLADTGKYILKFLPSSGYQISYADTGTCWSEASIYYMPCGAGQNAYFLCQPYGVTGGTGTGSLSGKVVEGANYGQKLSGTTVPGNPIGGVIVKGGKNPGGQFFAQTTTDAAGHYAFNNLPPGDYFVLVDIPGLDTINPWYVTLNNNNANYLDWTADSAKVLGGGSVSVNELIRYKYAVNLYPNPATQYVTFNYTLTDNTAVKIELYDIVGRREKELFYITSEAQGEHQQTIRLPGLKPGVYFVKLIIDDNEMITKLLVTD